MSNFLSLTKIIANERRTSIVLAHMNYARLIAPMEDDIMNELRSAMGPINSIAKSTPGFIWSFDGDVDTTNDER